MELTILPNGRILWKYFASQGGVNQPGMDSEDRNPARVPLHVKMQTQKIHRRLACRIPRQMADVRMAQCTTYIDYFELVIPPLDGTFVKDGAHDEKGSYGVRLQNLGELGGCDSRGRRCLVADCSSTDQNVDFSGRANDGLYCGAVGDGRCVYRDFQPGKVGFQLVFEIGKG